MDSIEVADLDASPDVAQGCIVLWKAILLTYCAGGSAFLLAAFIIFLIVEISRYWYWRTKIKHGLPTMEDANRRMREEVQSLLGSLSGKGRKKGKKAEGGE